MLLGMLLVRETGISSGRLGLWLVCTFTLPLKVVHFDLVHSYPFPFFKIVLHSTPLLYSSYKYNNQTCGWVCSTRLYHFIELVESEISNRNFG